MAYGDHKTRYVEMRSPVIGQRGNWRFGVVETGSDILSLARNLFYLNDAPDALSWRSRRIASEIIEEQPGGGALHRLPIRADQRRPFGLAGGAITHQGRDFFGRQCV
jgi:hypothetical protein